MATFRYQHLKGTLNEMRKRLKEDELGVNDIKGEETIYLKNTEGDVVSFTTTTVLEKRLEELMKHCDDKDSSYEDALSDLRSKLSSISNLLGVNDGNVDDYDDSGDGILDELHRDFNALRDKLKDVNEKRIVYWSDDEGAERRHIIIPNHDSIVGTMKNEIDNVNLLMLSKWDIVDVGSSKIPINLNGSNERPTYNDDNQMALVKDLPSMEVENEVLVLKQPMTDK